MRGSMKPASKGDYKRFDDYTLLRMEQESRKKHKMSVAKAVGAAAKILFKSPIAVFGIAKTGFKAHQTYMDHDEILDEIKLRGLKPLEAEPQESIYVMVAGQLLAVFIGHKLGENMANSYVEPLITRFGGAAVEKMSEKLTEHIAEEASESIFSNLFAKAHLRPNSANQATTTAGQPATQRPNSANSANSSNSHLSSRPASTRPTSAHSASSEVTAPDANGGHPGTLKPSRSATSLAALKEMATSVTAFGVSKATEMAQKYLSKPSVTSASLQTISPTYSGEWTGFAEELEIVAVQGTDSDDDHSKQDFGVHALFLKLSAGVTQLERTANGQKKEVVCIARYRMRFLVQFEGSRVTGKNMVDDLAIVGQVQDAQSHFYFTEMAKESTGQEITVYYQGGVVNDELVGEWVASDKRQGLFRLGRSEKIK